MMPSDLPPGVSVSASDIPGNGPEDVAWEAAYNALYTLMELGYGKADVERLIGHVIADMAEQETAMNDEVQRAAQAGNNRPR